MIKIPPGGGGRGVYSQLKAYTAMYCLIEHVSTSQIRYYLGESGLRGRESWLLYLNCFSTGLCVYMYDGPLSTCQWNCKPRDAKRRSSGWNFQSYCTLTLMIDSYILITRHSALGNEKKTRQYRIGDAVIASEIAFTAEYFWVII